MSSKIEVSLPLSLLPPSPSPPEPPHSYRQVPGVRYISIDGTSTDATLCVGLRGAAGDSWVGVGSVFESGARARGKSFIIYFSGVVEHHTFQKKRKIWLPRNRVRARTPSPDFFSWACYVPTLGRS